MKRSFFAVALAVLLPLSLVAVATETTPPREGPNGKDATLQVAQPSGYGQMNSSSVTLTFPPPADPPPPFDASLFLGSCSPTARGVLGTTQPYTTNWSTSTNSGMCRQGGSFTSAAPTPLYWFPTYWLTYKGAYLDPAVWAVSWAGCTPSGMNFAICTGADVLVDNPALVGSDTRDAQASAVVTFKASGAKFTVTLSASMMAIGSSAPGGGGGGIGW